MLRILLLLALLAAPAETPTPVTLRGQLVCSGCWTEADRDTVVYGNEADHACAARCAKDGLPAGLAVYREGKFALYRLADAPALKDKRLAWIGRAVEIRGTLAGDAKGEVLRPEAITGIAWQSLGFPTGPPPR